MLTVFSELLGERCRASGVVLNRWGGAGRRSQNLLELLRGTHKLLLYVKESNLESGWWGLNSTRLELLRRSGYDWYVAFLLGEKQEGFLVSSEIVERQLKSNWREAPSDGDFKVHQHSELGGIVSRLSYDELAAQLAAHLK